MRTTDRTLLLAALTLLSNPEELQGRAYHQYSGDHVTDLYPQESYYTSYLLPSSPGLTEDIERQDVAAVAGLSLAMIGMAFSAAFTGALIAPVIRMGMARAMDTINNLDIRMPVFPKDIFDEDYPEYEEYEYEYDDIEEEVIDTKKKLRKNRKQSVNY